MEIYSIGFTQSTAKHFFNRIRENGIKRLIDVRLNNVSQLSGFAKREDLRYFLHEICGTDYVHMPLLAPTQELLKEYQKGKILWPQYEEQFYQLMVDRDVKNKLSREYFSEPSVLLCSEATAEQCHRRLVIEYLITQWPGIRAVHL